MTSVKGSALRHPVVIAIGAASLATLLGLNVVAFVQGLAAPTLLGAVIISDRLVIGAGILVAAREVLVAEHRTQASEARLGSIVDSDLDVIITVDEAQNIVLFNRAAERVFRCPRGQALGAPLERFIPERFRAVHRQHIEHFGRTDATGRKMGEAAALVGLRADGEEFPLEAWISQTGDVGRRYYTVILRDITERRELEAEAERVRSTLSETQARLAAIVDSAMDAIITVDEQQRIALFNRAAEQVFGLRRDEVLGTSLDRFLPPRFRVAHREHLHDFGRTGVTSRRMGDVTTLWALRANGEEFPIEASISQIAQEEKRYFTVILRDITTRKEAEDQLKRSQRELRELSVRVFEAREEEKTRIARELHDELGQLLTALKMDLSSLRQALPEHSAELAAKTAEMQALLDQTVSSTRRIAADLRPLMLDDLGLVDAASWLVEDFAKRSGIKCEIRLLAEDSLQDASKGVGTAVYRVLQESLTNIARHSRAKNAWVIFTGGDGSIQVEIEDDGRGIVPEDLAKVRSLGLKGMRERITYLGGSFEIARAPRGGTRVRITVPARDNPSGAAT